MFAETTDPAWVTVVIERQYRGPLWHAITVRILARGCGVDHDRDIGARSRRRVHAVRRIHARIRGTCGPQLLEKSRPRRGQ